MKTISQLSLILTQIGFTAVNWSDRLKRKSTWQRSEKMTGNRKWIYLLTFRTYVPETVHLSSRKIKNGLDKLVLGVPDQYDAYI